MARTDALRIYTGTSGYSYKEWKGPFYPEKIKPEEMLGFYSQRLRAVEINNTFYRMPKEEVMERWYESVGDDFRFILKASRRITHFGRLKNAADSVDYLLEMSAPLGEKRGPILFQLPPKMSCDTDRLASFLAVVPEAVPIAFEFRHDSWFTDEVYQLLRGRGGAGAALCLADSEEDGPEPELVETADFGYLRLRRPGYSDAALGQWRERILERGWRECFVFFKHEDDGAGPAMAQQFESLFD